VAHHTALGLRAGLTRGQIAALGGGALAGVFDARERLVLGYTAQLTTRAGVDDALHAELRRHLSDREIVELAVTVATANYTNRINAALAIEPDR